MGLGWVLNAGGVITREVRGLRDECLKQVEKNRTLYGYYYAWKKSLSVVDQPKELLRKELLYSESMKMEDMSFIEMLRDDLPNDMIVSRATPYNERYDAEPDVFRFNFCGLGSIAGVAYIRRMILREVCGQIIMVIRL